MSAITAFVAVLVLAGSAEWPLRATAAPSDLQTVRCVKPAVIQRLVFSAREYPNIRRHFRGAVRRGWPLRLVLNRRGAEARRDRLLESFPIRVGFDRDGRLT